MQSGRTARHQFIEDLGHTMVTWGLTRTTGRIYAYLLLRNAPASLDDMADELDIAKSGASVASRQLVAIGLARAIGARGSRRLLYEALLDPDAIMSARNAQTRIFADRLRQGAHAAGPGQARRRLDEMAGIVEDLSAELPALVRRVRERRRK
jgi:DNA-binding transcriptional regulator GbsR (MarR family)